MKRTYLLLVGLLLTTSLFAQREDFNRAIINENSADIIKYGEMLLFSGGKPTKELYRKLAQAYREKNSYNKSIDYLNRAYELDSSDVKTSFALGEAYLNSGDEELAMNSFLKVIDLDRNNTQALSLILKLNLSSGQRDLAAINALQLCSIDSTNALYFVNLGRIYESGHKDKPALKAYLKARELNPKSLTTSLLLCNAQIQNNQLDSAIRTAYSGLNMAGNPKSRSAILLRRNIAKALYLSGSYDSCLVQVAKLKADGDTIEDETYKRAGYAYLNQKDHLGVSDEFQKVWDKNNNNIQLTFEIPFYLGKSYLEINDPLKAIKYISKSIETLLPNNIKLYKAYIANADCYSRLKKHDSAIEQLNNAKWYLPENTEPYMKIASIYEFELKDYAKRNEEYNSYLKYVDNIRMKNGAIEEKLESSYRYVKDALESNTTSIICRKGADGKMRTVIVKTNAKGEEIERKEYIPKDQNKEIATKK